MPLAAEFGKRAAPPESVAAGEGGAACWGARGRPVIARGLDTTTAEA
jgi:hypothetical protein